MVLISLAFLLRKVIVSPEKAGMDKYRDQIDQVGYGQSKMLFRIKWDQDIDFKLLSEIIDFQIEEKADYTKFWRKA